MNTRTALAFAHPQPSVAVLLEESLTAPQWADLLGISHQAFRSRCQTSTQSLVEVGGKSVLRQVFAFGSLPADYQQQLTTLREKHAAPGFVALLDMKRVETRKWEPPKAWSEYLPSTRARAEIWQATMAVYYRAENSGLSKSEANRLARNEYERLTKKSVSSRQIDRKRDLINERGGELAPMEAYCDEKACVHMAARREVPEDFLMAVRSKAVEPSVGTMAAAVRHFELEWQAGKHVPGIGRRESRHQDFPFTAKQLGDRQLLPGKAARTVAAQGKFRAKTLGFLPAPALASTALRLRERIVFDDKRLDMQVKDDITGRPLSVMLYIAMDEATRQILGYLVREDGGVRQTDVEGLTSFILRVAGFAGRSAGYATTLKFERGTVAISALRQALIEKLFPGEIIISRTDMIGGHNVAGDFAQAASGNFFGKGKLESFMRTLDEITRHLPGQRGNVYRNQPLMLGDLLLTPENLAGKNYKPKGSLIEEAVLTAQTAQALHWQATGELPGAYTAAQATGVKGPLLYITELHTAIQATIAYYNAQRGHDREGFLDLPMILPNGGLRHVAESSNDKAARLERELAAQGKQLQRISEADAMMLLHKVKRVVVRAKNGIKTSIGGVERTYWHEHSVAVHDAASQQSGEKEYLALYNPEDPRELYLLRNTVGRVPLTATSLPEGEEPHFLESLPLYLAPEANDPLALAERAKRVAAQSSSVQFEVARAIVPFIAEHTQRREAIIEATEPLRAAVSVLRDEAAKAERPTSAAAEEMAAMATEAPGTRLAARPAAESELARFQREHAADHGVAETTEEEPEII